MYGKYPDEFRSPFEGVVPARFNARGPQDERKRGGRSPFAGNSAGRSGASHGKRSPGAALNSSKSKGGGQAPANGLPFRRKEDNVAAERGVNRADRRAKKFVGPGNGSPTFGAKAARASNANEGADLKPKRKTHRAGRRGQGHPLGQKPGGPNPGPAKTKVVVGKK